MDYVIILLLTLMNGMFCLAEVALLSCRRPRLAAAAEKSRSARIALRLFDDPTRFLSIAQVGITVAILLAGAFGEKAIAGRFEHWLNGFPVLAPYSRGLGFTLSMLIITYVSLILGELVPKRLGIIAPEFLASAMAIPMQVVSAAAAPVIWLLSVSTDLTLRLVPIRARPDHESAELEIRALMKTGTQAGVFHEEEQRIVERVFRLSDQTVKALMVPRTDIDWLAADDTVNRIRVAVATSSHSHFPVCKTGLDDLVGVVHVKDLVKAGIIADDISLKELIHEPLFVPETTPALKLLEMFKENQDHIAFVLDEHGAVEGLVTLRDVVEAIVGEVAKRDEVEDPMVVRRRDGSYLLDGMLPVDELKSLLGEAAGPLPKEDEADFQTLGGFVLVYLGRIPTTGDVFSFGRFRFEIVDMDRRRIDKVLLTIEPEPTKEGT